MTDQSTKQTEGKSPVYRGCFTQFPRALKEVARVSEWGAGKYNVPLSKQGWRRLPVEERQDATARHMLDRAIDGEVNHKDGGMLHLAQQAWDSLAALEVMLVEKEKLEAACPMVETEPGEIIIVPQQENSK